MIRDSGGGTGILNGKYLRVWCMSNALRLDVRYLAYSITVNSLRLKNKAAGTSVRRNDEYDIWR